MNRIWALCVLCTSTLYKHGGGGGVNRLWAPYVLCTSTLCKRGGGGGGGVNRLWGPRIIQLTHVFARSTQLNSRLDQRENTCVLFILVVNG